MEIKEIIEKDFTKSLIGYNCKEVDTFLDDIISQIEIYEKNQKEMLTALDYLLNELEKFESDDKSAIIEKSEKKNGIRQKVQNTADTIRKNMESVKNTDVNVPVYTDAAKVSDEVKKHHKEEKNEETSDNNEKASKQKIFYENRKEYTDDNVKSKNNVSEPEFLKIRNSVSKNKKITKEEILEDTFNELQKELNSDKGIK